MLLLTEDQQMLADSARQLIEAEAPITRQRQLRDAGETLDLPLWQQLTELGWPSVPFGEEHDGLGMGLAGLAVVMEELGRQLVPTPLISTAMISVLAPELGAQHGEVIAVAWRERVHGRDATATVEAREGRLHGRKLAVLDANAAERFVVSATDGLYVVDAADVAVTRRVRVDHRDVGDLRIDGAPGVRLDVPEGALEGALDAGTVAQCAEMLGGMSRAMSITRDYLIERRQFGVPIGSFQVLQHRMVDIFIELELVRSCVLAAARDPSPRLVSLAKARCAEGYLHATKEAVQLLGGIGMTDEHDIGLFLKHALVSAQVLGTADWHRDRWAALGGY